MRVRINDALKTAIKDQDKIRSATLRLIMAAVKDRDIAARSDDNYDGVSDAEILDILSKMVRQRNESATTYEEAGRPELAERERAEISIIEEFLPEQMSAEDVQAVVAKTIEALEAQSFKDMGRVMAALKADYAGEMDFGQASAIAKKLLS